MAKDESEEIDSNKLDQLFCEFIQEVIDEYAVCVKHGDYVAGLAMGWMSKGD